MDFNANIINPFIESAVQIINTVTGIQLSIGKPYLRSIQFNEKQILIMVGVTGEMKGQVIFDFPEDNAKEIASAMMMGMPVDSIDDMAASALNELGNMIMGTAATSIANTGVIIDITPPMLQRGMINIGQPPTTNICIPLLKDGNNFLSVNILVKTKDK